jgi:hypothetical protein
MPRLEFEAETLAELTDLVRYWLAGAQQAAQRVPMIGRDEQVRAAMRLVRGEDSRRLLRELAQRAVAGDGPLALDADLRRRYAKASGTAFAGIVGGPNKLMRRVAGRDLIQSAGGGYRVDPADAAIVLQAWPADQPGQDRR